MREADHRAWLPWYKKSRWINRARHQLKIHPLCKMCLAKSRVTAGQLADHVIPHRGDPILFWYGELQTLCWPCHSSAKSQLESKGYVNDIGTDGFPVDAKHPFNTEGRPYK